MRVGGARARDCYPERMSNHGACEKRIAELEAENATLKVRLANQMRIRDLGKVARAQLFRIESERGLSGSQIARAYGYKSGSYVMNRIRIVVHGSKAVVAAWDAGEINDTKAEELARETRSHEEQDTELRKHRTRSR